MSNTTRNYSLAEAVALIRSDKSRTGRPFEPGSSVTAGDWHGAPIELAWQQQETGDQETLTRIDAEAQRIGVSGGSDTGTLEMLRDVAGDFPLVDCYLTGEPENMGSFENAAPGKIVSLVVDICAAGANPAQALRDRGVQIFKAIRALELNGYAVGLSVFARTEARRSVDTHSITVQIKAPGDYLSPAIAAYWIASPASFRRSVFNLWERESTEIRKVMGFYVGEGYGLVRAANPEEFPDAVYIPNIDSSTGDAFDLTRGTLATRGIEISG